MDTNNHYEIYQNDCFNLAETIVIKSDYSAKILNKNIRITAPDSFVSNDRKTWKYYMNLAGDYYPTDKTMYVQSDDTQETIIFSKDNLRLHRATRREYAYGTKRYMELLTRYPDQESLILGILYPVDYSISIDAEEFSVIGYPSHLIEEQEQSLTERIELFVRRMAERWFIKGYNTYEEAYFTGFLSQIYVLLPGLIITARKVCARTNEAHSYHIRQYLASNQGLDRYFDSMNLEQRLWFYRNIRWINLNAGRAQTYQKLIDKIMTLRKLALSSYTMTHDTEDIIEELVPDVLFKRQAKNKYVSMAFREDVVIEDLLAKEDPVARNNLEARIDQADHIRFRFQHSLSNRVQTKALESAMFDYTDATPFPMSDILMNHWPYLASKGLYRAYVRISNPRTGDIIPLSVKDAYVFAQYLLLQHQGIEIKEIQPVICRKVQVIPTVSTKDMLAMTNGKWFDEDFARDLKQFNPDLTQIVSIDSFWEACNEIFKAMQYQRAMTSWQEHWRRRGEVQGMSARLYGVMLTHLEPEGTLYADWFADKGIDLDDFPIDNYEQIYKGIVEQALGLDLRTTDSLKNLQRQMLNMFGNLSSYSIQFISEINDNALKIIEWPVIRFGDWQTKAKALAHYIDVAIGFRNLRAKSLHALHYDVNSHVKINGFEGHVKHSLKLRVPRQFLSQPIRRVIRLQYHMSGHRFTMKQPRPNYYPNGQYPLPGINTTFMNLTAEQQRSLPDMYQDNWWNGQETPFTV